MGRFTSQDGAFVMTTVTFFYILKMVRGLLNRSVHEYGLDIEPFLKKGFLY